VGISQQEIARFSRQDLAAGNFFARLPCVVACVRSYGSICTGLVRVCAEFWRCEGLA
jgi:hypothetical protein